jgi:hypothetical protein
LVNGAEKYEPLAKHSRRFYLEKSPGNVEQAPSPALK